MKRQREKHLLLVLAIVLAKLTLLGWRWIETELDQMKRVKYKTGDLLIDKTVEKKLKDYRNILIMGIDSKEGENINQVADRKSVV